MIEKKKKLTQGKYRGKIFNLPAVTNKICGHNIFFSVTQNTLELALRLLPGYQEYNSETKIRKKKEKHHHSWTRPQGFTFETKITTQKNKIKQSILALT